MTNEHEDRMHELLCAYILGEASDDERVLVENALADSAELRAEKERVEKTIGFVKSAMGKSEALSPQAAAQVMSAAGAPRKRPWHAQPMFRMAAGIAAVAIVYATYRSSQVCEAPEGSGIEVARLNERVDRDLRGAREPQDKKSTLDSTASAPASSAKVSDRVDKPVELAEAQTSQLNYPDNSNLKLQGADIRPPLASGAATTPQDGVITLPADKLAALNSAILERKAIPPSEPKLETFSEDFYKDASSALPQEQALESGRPSSASIGVGALGKAAPNKESATQVGAVVSQGQLETGKAKDPTSAEKQAGDVYYKGRAGAATTPGIPGVATGGAGTSPSSPSGSSILSASGRAALAPPASAGAPPSRLSGEYRFQGGGKITEAERSMLAGLGYASGEAPAKNEERRLRPLGYLGSSDSDEDAFIRERLGIDPGSYRSPGDSAPSSGITAGEDDRFNRRQTLWTPELRDQYVDWKCRRIVTDCCPRPNERPRDMYFRFWGDNSFELTALDALSTFSIDVDTASYTLARRYLADGHLPEKAQVRTEEFINYFKPDVPAPREGTFAIHTDLTPSRFSADAGRSMLRVVVRGREVAKEERKPLALTFVLDVSGSMKENNRLEMVKHAIRLLVSQLDGNDAVAFVSFSTDARMILPMTSARNRELIESAIYPLQPEGSTNSEAGLRMGYAAALSGLNPNATNRVVFLSDGVANVGVVDPNVISDGVKSIREKGVYLNTIGVGMNNHNDVLLEQLADKGDGVCNYIDNAAEARRVMVDNFTGAMEMIARDVKIQVEFDPAQVFRYRLLGYENRAIADQDFRNDAVDAGEVGAGHQVTALYELERTSSASEKPLAIVRLRWKAPRVPGAQPSEEATEGEHKVFAASATGFAGTDAGYRRAVVVAQFAEFLRRSTHTRGESYDDMLAEARKLAAQSSDKDFNEFVAMVEKAKTLILQSYPPCDDFCRTVDLLRENQIRRAQYDCLKTGHDAKLVEELAKHNADLEQKIKDLLRKRIDEQPR